MTETPIFNVLIIGAGQIAGGYDEQSTGKTMLSHMGAYASHPGFRVIACVEPNADRRTAFIDYWDIPMGFATLEQALSKHAQDIHIASVCSPTANHLEDLQGLLNTAPKLHAVLCEKPIGKNIGGVENIVTEYKKKSVALLVNYFRRWDDAITSLRGEILNNQWGSLQNIAAYYGKGILHNGSHIIDLLSYVFGEIKPITVIRRQADNNKEDPSLDVVLQTSCGAPVYLLGTDSKLYDLFEIHLTFEKGQITLENGATTIRSRRPRQNPLFPSHRNLEHGQWIDTTLNEALPRAISDLYNCALKRVENAPSTGTTALQTLRLCQRLLRMPLDNQETTL